MTLSLYAHLLPELLGETDLAESDVVVIDVLRASTTLACALAAGVREVIPCLEVDEARQAAERLPPELTILGGERGGLPIEGFDLGNSPDEYTPQRVAGRVLVFTTTNGTKALDACRHARRVVLGGFINSAAVVNSLDRADRVDLVCAGTRGQVSREDVLCAGLLIERLRAQAAAGRRPVMLDDEAEIALAVWQAEAVRCPPAPRQFDRAEPITTDDLAAALAASRGGRNLTALGLDRDLQTAARLDLLNCVPRWDPTSNRIRTLEPHGVVERP